MNKKAILKIIKQLRLAGDICFSIAEKIEKYGKHDAKSFNIYLSDAKADKVYLLVENAKYILEDVLRMMEWGE